MAAFFLCACALAGVPATLAGGGRAGGAVAGSEVGGARSSAGGAVVGGADGGSASPCTSVLPPAVLSSIRCFIGTTGGSATAPPDAYPLSFNVPFCGSYSITCVSANDCPGQPLGTVMRVYTSFSYDTAATILTPPYQSVYRQPVICNGGDYCNTVASSDACVNGASVTPTPAPTPTPAAPVPGAPCTTALPPAVQSTIMCLSGTTGGTATTPPVRYPVRLDYPYCGSYTFTCTENDSGCAGQPLGTDMRAFTVFSAETAAGILTRPTIYREPVICATDFCNTVESSDACVNSGGGPGAGSAAFSDETAAIVGGAAAAAVLVAAIAGVVVYKNKLCAVRRRPAHTNLEQILLVNKQAGTVGSC